MPTSLIRHKSKCFHIRDQGRHALIIFEGARGGGFKTFPNALTISWNISIVYA